MSECWPITAFSAETGASPVDATADAEATYTWLRVHAGELGMDPKRIVLAGASSGGQLAAVTAVTAHPDAAPAALVLFNPVLDFARLATNFHVADAQAKQISPNNLPLDHLLRRSSSKESLIPPSPFRPLVTFAPTPRDSPDGAN